MLSLSCPSLTVPTCLSENCHCTIIRRAPQFLASSVKFKSSLWRVLASNSTTVCCTRIIVSLFFTSAESAFSDPCLASSSAALLPACLVLLLNYSCFTQRAQCHFVLVSHCEDIMVSVVLPFHFRIWCTSFFFIPTWHIMFKKQHATLHYHWDHLASQLVAVWHFTSFISFSNGENEIATFPVGHTGTFIPAKPSIFIIESCAVKEEHQQQRWPQKPALTLP